jgi:hypothetical protein
MTAGRAETDGADAVTSASSAGCRYSATSSVLTLLLITRVMKHEQ